MLLSLAMDTIWLWREISLISWICFLSAFLSASHLHLCGWVPSQVGFPVDVDISIPIQVGEDYSIDESGEDQSECRSQAIVNFNVQGFWTEGDEEEQVELGYGWITRKNTEKMLMNIQ